MRASGWTGGEEGGCPPLRLPLVGEVKGAATLRIVRVGACNDELRLMGVEWDKVSTGGNVCMSEFIYMYSVRYHVTILYMNLPCSESICIY